MSLPACTDEEQAAQRSLGGLAAFAPDQVVWEPVAPRPLELPHIDSSAADPAAPTGVQRRTETVVAPESRSAFPIERAERAIFAREERGARLRLVRGTAQLAVLAAVGWLAALLLGAASFGHAGAPGSQAAARSAAGAAHPATVATRSPSTLPSGTREAGP